MCACVCACACAQAPPIKYRWFAITQRRGPPPQHTTAIIFIMEIKLICFPLLYRFLPLSTSSIACSLSLLSLLLHHSLHTFISIVCVLPSSVSLCFTAMLQQARQQPTASIGVRFVNRTMEREAIRCFLAPLKTFVANRLELVLAFLIRKTPCFSVHIHPSKVVLLCWLKCISII